MPQNEVEVAPLTRKQAKEEIIQVENPEGENEGFHTSEDGASNVHKDSWGAGDVAAWRQTGSTGSDPDDGFSKALIKELNELDALKNRFEIVDKVGRKIANTSNELPDGFLSRNELFFEAKETAKWSPESASADIHALKNFARLSGGNNVISKNDLERAILGNLTSLLEESAVSGKFSPEVRGAIAQWADKMNKPQDAKLLQDQLNKALEGTGLQANLERATGKNYLGEDYSFSTVTILNQNKELDKFSFAHSYTAERSLLGGKNSKNGIVILDNADPDKTFSPEMKKDMKDLRALHTLMNSPLMEEGGITFKDAAKNEKTYAEREHAQRFLQDNFAKLAMGDGDGNTVSKKDVRYSMEETLSSLIKKHLSRDGSNRNALVEEFVKDALRDDYIGNSDTFTKTLNAALDKYGYKATLSDEYNPNGRATLPIERKLTIEDKLTPEIRKDIKVTLPNPNIREVEGTIYKNSQGIRNDPSYQRNNSPNYQRNNDPRVLGRTPAG